MDIVPVCSIKGTRRSVILKILVIDGQGGKIGRQLIETILASVSGAEILAVGTNSTATSNMMKGGAKNAATGENAVIVGCRTADVIIGPIGIVLADALFGEITPAMSAAVGSSTAQKILIPINKCGAIVAGTQGQTITDLIQYAVAALKDLG